MSGLTRMPAAVRAAAPQAQASEAGRAGRAANAVVAAIVILAAVIRIPGLLRDGLWRDQANVYVQLAAPSFAQFLHRVAATEWHPPLFFLLAYGWAKLAGTSELALEIVPFVLSVVSVWLVYRLGEELDSPATGMLAAGLYAIAPIAVDYSCEYLYPQACCLSTLLALLVVRARTRPPTAGSFAGLALITLAVVFTHYTALLYVPLLGLWSVVNAPRIGRGMAAAAALLTGALPFAFWLPVFAAQRNIGIPYRAAATLGEKVLLFFKLSAGFSPIRPTALELVFVVFLLAGLAVVAGARMLERAPVSLGLLFATIIAALAALNLSAGRYALPYFGLGCVSAAWIFVRAAALAGRAAPAARSRWGGPALAGLVSLGMTASFFNVVDTTRLPKSGIRAIVHDSAADAGTLYVLAPDYLASTFAFYAQGSHPAFAGFVRWQHPEVFALAGYAADWSRPDAVERTLREVAAAPRRETILDVIADDDAADAGNLRYGRVAVLLRDLRSRYRLLDRIRHPGRYEAITEFRFALREPPRTHL